jgi:mono/diheme cytochrome c family protein
MKGVRIAVATAAIVAGFFVLQFSLRPIDAAAQTAADSTDPGAKSYAEHCAICHGDRREGILPGFPPLLGISHQMTDDKIADLVHAGKGRMPGFPELKDGEMTVLVHFLSEPSSGTTTETVGNSRRNLVRAGDALFHQNCAFCHGRDAMGGETGPDLTSSKLVKGDTSGQMIAAVVREGRPGNKMPAFNFSSEEIGSLIAFIRAREAAADAQPGGRRGVAVADLQTGNAEAGRQFFEGAGGCARCHSPHGDLAGIATRYEGLKLEQRMLYPEDAKSTATVTLPSGQRISGTLAYRDEFTIALRDSSGVYHSWTTSRVHYTVDSPVEAHVKLFPRYTDDDVHNLMAYLQTLR